MSRRTLHLVTSLGLSGLRPPRLELSMTIGTSIARASSAVRSATEPVARASSSAPSRALRVDGAPTRRAEWIVMRR